MWRTLLVTSFVSVVGATANADLLFYEDFEDGFTEGWQELGRANFVREATVARSGRFSAAAETIDCTLRWDVGSPRHGITAEAWIHDNGLPFDEILFFVSAYNEPTTSQNFLSIGVEAPLHANNYFVMEGHGPRGPTSVERSVGWHLVQIHNQYPINYGYIDGQRVYAGGFQSPFQFVGLYRNGLASENISTAHGYWDDIAIYEGPPILGGYVAIPEPSSRELVCWGVVFALGIILGVATRRRKK
jgi:hypothetical protein